MEVNCGSLPLGILFLFRPTPSCRLSHTCGPQIIPRPQVGGRADRYRFACGRRRHNPLVSHRARPLSHAVRSLLPAIARYCPFLLASAHSRFLPFHGIPLPIPLFVSGGGTGSGFRFAGSTLFACFNRHGKGGEGIPSRRLLPAPPVSPFLLACLRLFSFPYFPGMVMGYSVATVMYFS